MHFIPISTIGYSIDQLPPNQDGLKINHIHQIPMFQNFTMDEIRYYDYLSQDYISPAKSDNPQIAAPPANPPIQPMVFQPISPWSINFPNIAEPEAVYQSSAQPYGQIPDAQFQMPSNEEPFGDQQQQQEEVPLDPGLNQPSPIFQFENNNDNSNNNNVPFFYFYQDTNFHFNQS